ncbi:MAG: flavodoxin family protein [Thermodesulfobacteriota bacterium]
MTVGESSGASGQGVILALQGSPRRGGNTDRLLDQVLNGAAEKGLAAKKVFLRDLKISPCLELNHCLQTGRCAIDDDMTGLYDHLVGARVLILASPIFFYGPSALLKAAIDRGQALWARKYVLKIAPPASKGQGYLVATAATGGGKLFDGLRLTARYFFDVLDLEPAGELLVRGLAKDEDLERRTEVLAEARILGHKIAAFLGGPIVDTGRKGDGHA